jgi:hypothetical protein
VVLGSEIQNGEPSRSLDRLDVVREEHLSRRIDPVQVLDHGDARLPCALRVGEPLHQREQSSLARLRVHPLDRARGIGDGEEVEEQRQLVVEGLVE